MHARLLLAAGSVFQKVAHARGKPREKIRISKSGGKTTASGPELNGSLFAIQSADHTTHDDDDDEVSFLPCLSPRERFGAQLAQLCPTA